MKKMRTCRVRFIESRFAGRHKCRPYKDLKRKFLYYQVMFVVFPFLFCVFSPIWAARLNPNLEIKGQTLSVQIKEVPLKVVLKMLEREIGVWFKGDQSLYEEPITIRFMDLSYEDGIRRILSAMNFSFIFDRNKNLEGVFIFGKASSGRKVIRRQGVTTKKISSTRSTEESKYGSTFKVIRNSPPPGNPHPKLINMKTVKKCPPPGNPNPSPVDMTVIKNCPPPGGPADGSTDELEQFKVIKNFTPPGS